MRAGRCVPLLFSALAVPVLAFGSDVVSTGADLGVVVTAPATFTPGTTAYAIVLVVNYGPDAAEGVSLELIYSVGLNLVSTTGACTSWPCSVGTLGAGTFAALTMRFDIPASYTSPQIPALIFVSAAATTPDPFPDNDGEDAVVPVQPEADVALKLSGPPAATPPHQLIYTLAVTNNGPSDAVPVEVRDPAPVDLELVSVGGDCSGTLPCLFGTLAPGATRTMTVTFRLPSPYSGPDPIHNEASVVSETADPDFTNNQASVDTLLDSATPALGFHTIAPCRLADTRDPSGPTGGAPLDGGVEYALTASGHCNVPATARAVVLNATTTAADGTGTMRLWPAGKPMPTAAMVNYRAGQTRSAHVIVGLDALGALALEATGSTHVHLVLDATGYFE
jgi:uncharacterized repeat protein (TIGR01451 family)